MPLRRTTNIVVAMCMVLGILIVNASAIQASGIPTTSNPTINTANGGVRTMQNVSFEEYGSVCAGSPTSFHLIRQAELGGWFSTQPNNREMCSGVLQGTVSDLYRVIELQAYGTFGRLYTPQDGVVFAELNAYVAGMLYQPMCVRNNDEIEFSFAHRPTYPNDTDIAAFRIGIPSGLVAGSTPQDSYSREILRVTSVHAGGIVTSVAQTAGEGTTANTAVISTTKWGIYSGTHTLPSTGYDGIRNVGFVAIQGRNAGEGNLLDDIRLGLDPIIDLGTTRDRSGNEGTRPTEINIRINGRVGAGTTIVLEQNAGTATPDADYTIGSVTAGKYGTATVVHTDGTSTWTITVPPGDYDGGIVAGSLAGGLTVPVIYESDADEAESTEWTKFNLKAPGAGGSSANWLFDDPTCDGSFKSDGAVYTITNVAPTATPTNTPTATNTPTHTFTPTLTPTTTNTPLPTATPAGQFIVFATPADRAEDAANFTLSATSNVGLTVSYVSTTPSVCTVTSAGVVSIVGFGSCSITASAPAGTVGGVPYAAAPDVTRTFMVKKKQTITFTKITDKVYNTADFSLSASASSTLPVTFTSSTPSVCTVSSGGLVNLLLPGTCTIAAAQAGGTSGGMEFAAASVITQSFTVNPVAQTLTIPTLPESHLYQTGLDLTGTSTSGLEITYTSSTPTVCTVVGRRVTFVSIGKCSIKGAQAGGTRGGIIYGPSADLVREFFVTNYTPTATTTPTNTRTFTPTQTPTPIPFMMKKGAVGASFVLGLLQNGTLITWGMNREFQANIPPCCGSGIDDIAVGTNFALALKGGRVYGWGSNSLKQISIPKTALKDITAIAAGGSFGLALNKKGGVVYWGSAKSPVKKMPKTLKKGIKLIAGGTDHALAVTTKNKIIGWGNGKQGQTKPPAKQLNKKVIIQVSAGLDHSLALLSTGMVVAWGNNSNKQAMVPTSVVDIKFISAGNKFSVALSSAGKVFAWGDNSVNQLNIPTEYTDIYTVAASYTNTILGLRNGRVIVIGDQTNGVDVSRTPTRTATPTP